MSEILKHRPCNMRPLLTSGYYDGHKPFSVPKLHADRKGPVYHAGKMVASVGFKNAIRPVWMADDGAFRIGHTGDMIQMLDDLGISDRAF